MQPSLMDSILGGNSVMRPEGPSSTTGALDKAAREQQAVSIGIQLNKRMRIRMMRTTSGCSRTYAWHDIALACQHVQVELLKSQLLEEGVYNEKQYGEL